MRPFKSVYIILNFQEDSFSKFWFKNIWEFSFSQMHTFSNRHLVQTSMSESEWFIGGRWWWAVKCDIVEYMRHDTLVWLGKSCRNYIKNMVFQSSKFPTVVFLYWSKKLLKIVNCGHILIMLFDVSIFFYVLNKIFTGKQFDIVDLIFPYFSMDSWCFFFIKKKAYQQLGLLIHTVNMCSDW